MANLTPTTRFVTRTPGIYVLTIEHPALHPDKRQHYKWCAAPMPAGMEFHVQDAPWGDGTTFQLGRLRGFYQGLAVAMLPDTFTSALLRVETPTPSQYLYAKNAANGALNVLDALARDGVITLADVERYR